MSLGLLVYLSIWENPSHHSWSFWEEVEGTGSTMDREVEFQQADVIIGCASIPLFAKSIATFLHVSLMIAVIGK